MSLSEKDFSDSTAMHEISQMINNMADRINSIEQIIERSSCKNTNEYQRIYDKIDAYVKETHENINQAEKQIIALKGETELLKNNFENHKETYTQHKAYVTKLKYMLIATVVGLFASALPNIIKLIFP